MNNIIFTNVSYLGNAGDYWSSPLKYYNFEEKNVNQIHFLDFWDPITNTINDSYKIKDKIIVIGGGGLLSDNGYYLRDTINYLLENNKIIFWGVGVNTFRKPNFSFLNHKNILLSGIRDYDYLITNNYVPCPSCKISLFDDEYEINSEIGIIEHPIHPIHITGIPKISNSSDIIQLISFIGSKEIIITSSYHGVYWSQIMGKKVLYYVENEVPNYKFFTLKNRVTTCNSSDWIKKTNNLTSVVGFKKECREINDDFYMKVLELI